MRLFNELKDYDGFEWACFAFTSVVLSAMILGLVIGIHEAYKAW